MHIAPELFTNRRTVKSVLLGSFAGDVYAAGCLFYELYYRLPVVADEEIVKHPSSSYRILPIHVSRNDRRHSRRQDDQTAGVEI